MARSTEPSGSRGFRQSGKRTLVELGVAGVLLVALLFLARGCLGCIAAAAVTQLPPSIDARVGESGAEQIQSQYEDGREPTEAQRERVRAIFTDLLDGLTDEERAVLSDPEVHVVVDDTPNAFALPGGEVFVLTGLLERVGNDDGMLRGVLSHELGHAVERHGMRGLARKAAVGIALAYLFGEVNEIVVILASGAAQLDQLSYSREMESEADAFAVALLDRLGHDAEGLARFLESLGSQPVPELVSTHPDPVERADAIRSE